MHRGKLAAKDLPKIAVTRSLFNPFEQKKLVLTKIKLLNNCRHIESGEFFQVVQPVCFLRKKVWKFCVVVYFEKKAFVVIDTDCEALVNGASANGLCLQRRNGERATVF